jgi:hypothetical protein
VEAETKEKWYRRRLWKRTLLFIFLFLILAISLFYFVLPNVLYPLRIDKIPDGAFIVPWMEPSPSIAVLRTYAQNPYGPPPFNIDSVMQGALKLSMTFNISIAGGNRIIPSTVYLGHDMNYLYVGGEFRGMGLNPNNSPNVTLPNYLSIFFDVNNNGKLTFPEAGSQLPVFVYNDTWTTGGLYHDLLWDDYVETLHRASWTFAENYCSPNAPPGMTLASGFAEYDNPTGTLTVIFARFLRLPVMSGLDALQMRPGERWVMGFVVELGFGRWVSSGAMADNVDGWPQKIYPFLSDDSSWWPKLVIDLTNPPKTIPGQATPGVEL